MLHALLFFKYYTFNLNYVSSIKTDFRTFDCDINLKENVLFLKYYGQTKKANISMIKT